MQEHDETLRYIIIIKTWSSFSLHTVLPFVVSGV